SRAEKLGIKPGINVQAIGAFDGEFLAELAGTTDKPGKADLIFYLAPARASLNRLPDLISGLKPAGALWVVYPKGVKEIREIEVLEAGRAAGLKDIKVASFSQTHTALRFVIPVRDRVG